MPMLIFILRMLPRDAKVSDSKSQALSDCFDVQGGDQLNAIKPLHRIDSQITFKLAGI